MHLLAQAAPAVNWWPFVVLLISVGVIIVLITVLRVHAFFALIIAALTAGMLAGDFDPQTLPASLKGKSHWVQAVELTTAEMGNTAGRIGVVIALAAVISLCLMESGAADKVVRRFLAAFGEKRAGTAIVTSGYILSIPIFFDTFFMLLLPLARAMCLRTGKDYVLYILAICCGGVVTHSLCAPHPGPLAMAESLKLDLGFTIIVGIVAGILPTLASWFVAKRLNRALHIPMRDAGGVNMADLQRIVDKPEKELPPFTLAILPVILPILLISLASVFTAIQGRVFDASDLRGGSAFLNRIATDSDGPASFVRSNLTEQTRQRLGDTTAATPALQKTFLDEVNKLLRSGRSLYAAAGESTFKTVTLRADAKELLNKKLEGENVTRLNRILLEDAFPAELKPTRGLNATLFKWGDFIGNRNIALLIGALISIFILMRQRRFSMAKIGDLIGPPFETAGVIILITSAGGAFGLMLKNAGVGEAIKAAVAGHEINLLFLSWLVAAIIRIAQGSATVAMLTTAAMVYPIMSGSPLPYHPIYIFLAIGFGAMTFSWMNDSGFWVVGRLSGFTEKETLKTWSVIVTVNSVVGLLQTLVFAKLLPMV
jgi:gluconate:H+ symporter, GntP family